MMSYLNRKTRRLIVRPFLPKDYSTWRTAFLSLKKQKNTWDVAAGRPLKELERSAFRKLLLRHKALRKKDYYYDLGIFLKDGTLIGTVAAMEVIRGISHTAFLGYRIFNPYWGQGYGKEAVAAMIDIAFKDIKLHRFEAGIEPTNRRSIGLARALKMRREGVKRRAIYLRGKWVDLVVYTLTSEDLGLKFNSKNVRMMFR